MKLSKLKLALAALLAASVMMFVSCKNNAGGGKTPVDGATVNVPEGYYVGDGVYIASNGDGTGKIFVSGTEKCSLTALEYTYNKLLTDSCELVGKTDGDKSFKGTYDANSKKIKVSITDYNTTGIEKLKGATLTYQSTKP